MDHKIIAALKQPRVLMVGYNGANNTGAEALLQADIEDVQAVLGPGVRITIPTLNAANLRRYVKESPFMTIAPIPTLYFNAIRHLVRESDLVMLVEGSTYMDTWGSPLLWLFLWATKCAADMGKPVLSYAVDAGTLSRTNRLMVKNIASRTDLIVTRNSIAAKRLRDIGVTAPIVSTADNAFGFQPQEPDQGWLFREWPRVRSGIVGLAMVDFFLFPAVMRPFGPSERCYKWPYFFSDSPQRRRSSRLLADGYAALADHVVERTGKDVALICMEELDETLAGRVRHRMKHPESARIFSARKYDASQMTCLLRKLDLLVTSRFHAAVLSLAAAVPQVGIGHDSRLATLYGDLGIRKRWFMELNVAGKPDGEADAPEFFTGLQERVDALLGNAVLQKVFLVRGYRTLVHRASDNRRYLADFVKQHHGITQGCRSVRGAPTGGEESEGGAAWAA